MLLLLAAWTVAGAPFTSAAAGPDASPTGRVSVTLTTTSAAPPSTAAATTTTATATASGSATPAASGPLVVSSKVTNRQPNTLTIVVTITNQTSSGQTWRNVGIGLGSASLTLSNVDSRVNYEWSGTRACFAPGPAVTTVPAGGTLTFPFTITGTVPADVTETTLNHTGCS